MTHPIIIGFIIFVCSFGGAMTGLFYRSRLPGSYLCNDSRDTIKLGIGLIATMTALILGLLTATAKNSFDTIDKSIRQTASDVVALDRALVEYGPEAAHIRTSLKSMVANRLAIIWPEEGESRIGEFAREKSIPAEQLAKQIRALQPVNDEQKWLRERAMTLCEELLQTRWLLIANLAPSVTTPFLIALGFWLTITFATFGLLSPKNSIVIAIIVMCAVSVGSAVFLILEMDGPFDGVIRASSQPVLFALDRLDQA